MEPLERLRAKIAGFPGYDADLERRRSDEYVRSYLGEALTEFAERAPLSPEQRQRIDDLLLRVGFADPRDFATHQIVVGNRSTEQTDAMAAADEGTVELADRATSLDPASTNAYLDDVVATLDAREAAIRALTFKTT
jgi:hypothetical protein